MYKTPLELTDNMLRRQKKSMSCHESFSVEEPIRLPRETAI